MFAVIFEVQPKAAQFDAYLELAKKLKPELERIDGFIDNERFASRRLRGRILSLSTWRDEKAVIRWRTLFAHHKVQEKGRFEVLEYYHLRVGEITADTHIPRGHTLREQRLDETEIGEAKVATISELSPKPGKGPAGADPLADLGVPDAGTEGVTDHEAFESIYQPGKLLLLASWRDAAVAGHWNPAAIDGYGLRHRRVRIVRDYGLADRREAPQYYPPVPLAGGQG
jgi:heme-degrading monooxygenase HmoA